MGPAAMLKWLVLPCCWRTRTNPRFLLIKTIASYIDRYMYHVRSVFLSLQSALEIQQVVAQQMCCSLQCHPHWKSTTYISFLCQEKNLRIKSPGWLLHTGSPTCTLRFHCNCWWFGAHKICSISIFCLASVAEPASPITWWDPHHPSAAIFLYE